MSESFLEVFEKTQLMKSRVRWAITYIADHFGMTNKKIAKEIGCATSTINSYRRMVTDPGLDFFVYMIKYEFSLEWFALGAGEPFPGALATYPEVCGPVMATTLPDEFVFIPQMTGEISAGSGLVPDDRADLRVAFQRDWINSKGQPQNMSLIKVRGDSMLPTLLSGDLVMVDHSRRSIVSPGGIYAIAIDDEIMIKRVQPTIDDKVLVISDNKQYSTFETVIENVRVNGKVIWYARDLER